VCVVLHQICYWLNQRVADVQMLFVYCRDVHNTGVDDIDSASKMTTGKPADDMKAGVMFLVAV